MRNATPEDTMCGVQPTTPSLTRRDFLQVAGSSVALGAVAPTHLLPRFATASTFAVRFDSGAIVSLKHVGDAVDTEYIQDDRRLGDAIIKYRRGNASWETLDTSTFTQRA